VLVLDALQAFLKEIDPSIEVLQATNFADAMKLASDADHPDLAMLDVNMPGMNGLEGLGIMKRRFPDLPVVLLSGQTNPHEIRSALARGAAGFIPKELSGEAMIKALQLVLTGETYVPAIALGEGPGPSEACGDPTPDQASPLGALTPRERQVLALVCEGHSNKSIAREMGLQQATVGYHLGGIFRKLDVSTRTQAATLAMKLGFREPGAVAVGQSQRGRRARC
jgi:DNA-binding NarL/FixJ family response regulator